jgi:hypothetical protein
VLCDTDDFDENDYRAKKNREYQKKVFEWNENEYHVVEIGVDSIENKDLYNKIGEVIYSMPDGISQIFFVVDGRFTEKGIDIFNLLEDSIFKSGILDYVTIVRTKFSGFNYMKKCEKNKIQLLHNENEEIAKIARSCKNIIYVDNPPINIIIEDYHDEKRVEINKKIRARSRIILLNHLETVCQEKYYKLKTWDKLYNKIASHKTNKIGNIVEEVERNLKLEIPAFAKFDMISK